MMTHRRMRLVLAGAALMAGGCAGDTSPLPARTVDGCVVGERRCVGDGVERCADRAGVWETEPPCGPGGACSAGVCLEGPCDPGRSCVGQTAVACEMRSEDATTHVTGLADCVAAGGVCHHGTCAAVTCTPAAARCLDELRIATCTSDGGYEEVARCAAGSVCTEADGHGAACVPGACTRSKAICEDGRTILTCDARGTGVVESTCGSEERCLDGACVDAHACRYAQVRVSEVPGAVGRELTLATSDLGVDGSYAWQLTDPQGREIALAPSADAREVRFVPTEVGRYTATLDVRWPNASIPQCGSTVHAVDVIGGVPLEIVLRWETPGDPNRDDTGMDPYGRSAGADLDLHVVDVARASIDANEDGVIDGFGEVGADTFSMGAGGRRPTSNGTWGPVLLRDDRDGWGPEITTAALPSVEGPYDVYVTAWDDWGYGPSDATVEVYRYGALARTATLTALWGTWPALRVDWAAGTIEALGACAANGRPCTESAGCGADDVCAPTTWSTIGLPTPPER